VGVGVEETSGVTVAATPAVRHMAIDKPITQTLATVSNTSAIVGYSRLCVEGGSGPCSEAWSLDAMSLYRANMVLTNARGNDRETLQQPACQIVTMACSAEDARGKS
jgi:hypothetical protein